jgi:transposase
MWRCEHVLFGADLTGTSFTLDKGVADRRMLTLDQHVRVYLAKEPQDFRKQIDGLSLQVQEVLGLDPLSAHLFVFRNRSRDKLKVLYWHNNGFCLLYKRLSKGRFRWPRQEDAVYQCGLRELQWLLDGLDLRLLEQRPRLTYSKV